MIFERLIIAIVHDKPLLDKINAGLESIGALCRLWDCICLWEDRCYRGGSIKSAFFFLMWGVFNLFFYPSFGQHWSFWGAVAMTSMNGAWIVLALKFRNN